MISVHWLIQDKDAVPDEDDWLSPGEMAALAGLHVEKRRTEWRLGRWTAKHALAACLNCMDRPASWQNLDIRQAEDGAPEAYVEEQPAPCVLSISHRHGLGACALVPRPARVGCDLEYVEPRSERFVADYFTEAEQRLVVQAGVDGHPLVANLLWSAKESVLKTLREGLHMDTRALNVTLPPANAERGWLPLRVHCGGTETTYAGWWRRVGEHVFTLAADPAPDLPVPIPGIPDSTDALRDARV